MKRISRIIKKYRIAKKRTQEQMGNDLHVTEEKIAQWEKGKALPDTEMRNQISEVLSMDPKILLNAEQNEKRNKKKMIAISVIMAVVLLTVGVLSGIRVIKNILIESGYQDEVNSANQYAIDISMIELLANPGKYDGELVRVISVGNIEFEGNAIYLNKEDFQYWTGNCIWVELGKRAISYQEAEEYNGKYVIVEGFFNKNNSGHMGAFRGAIENVSRYELWEGDWLNR